MINISGMLFATQIFVTKELKELLAPIVEHFLTLLIY